MPIKIQHMQEDYRFSEFGRRWYFKETVEDATSIPVRTPLNGQPVIVHVVPTDSAKVQYTLSVDQDLELDQGIWLDWPMGEVTSDSIDSAVGAIKALRLVSTGSTFWEISV